MTMEKPVAANLTRIKFDGITFHRHNVNDVFHRSIFALSIQQPEIVAMKVHRMTHHAVVIKNDAQSLPALDQYFITFRNYFIVQTPHVTIHVAG